MTLGRTGQDAKTLPGFPKDLRLIFGVGRRTLLLSQGGEDTEKDERIDWPFIRGPVADVLRGRDSAATEARPRDRDGWIGSPRNLHR
jgi:hypothetical protein